MPSTFTTTFPSAASLKLHFAGEEGKNQLSGGTNVRFRNFDFVVKKEAGAGPLQIALKNVDSATSAEGEAVLNEVSKLLNETIIANEKQMPSSEPAAGADVPTAPDAVGTEPTDSASRKVPQFLSLPEAKSYLCPPASEKPPAIAKGFEIGSRKFAIQTVGAANIRITENGRSWLQAILSLFRLDDASVLRRAYHRHNRARAAADDLKTRIGTLLASRMALQTRGDKHPAYLSRALASMSMAPGAERSYLEDRINDSFFCRDNFVGIQKTEDPAVFLACFSGGGRRETIALSNYSKVEVKHRRCHPGLQGEVLQDRLRNRDYDSLHQLVRQWDAEQLQAALQAEVDALRSRSIAGVGDFLKDAVYRCDAMPAGYVFRIDSNLRLHYERHAATDTPAERGSESAS